MGGNVGALGFFTLGWTQVLAAEEEAKEEAKKEFGEDIDDLEDSPRPDPPQIPSENALQNSKPKPPPVAVVAEPSPPAIVEPDVVASSVESSGKGSEGSNAVDEAASKEPEKQGSGWFSWLPNVAKLSPSRSTSSEDIASVAFFLAVEAHSYFGMSVAGTLPTASTRR